MFTKEQIQKGLDNAYKQAGENAYFGNGFHAGIQFAQENKLNATESISVGQLKFRLEHRRFLLNTAVKEAIGQEDTEILELLKDAAIRYTAQIAELEDLIELVATK